MAYYRGFASHKCLRIWFYDIMTAAYNSMAESQKYKEDKFMSRTVVNMNYRNFQGLQERIFGLLQSRGYKNIIENNENVWKCGVGFWTAMKYVKIEYAPNNTLVVSGWIRPVMGSEKDLSGTVGLVPKKQVMNLISEIQTLL